MLCIRYRTNGQQLTILRRRRFLERRRNRFSSAVRIQCLPVSRRVRCALEDDGYPILASLMDVWPAVGWYEREAFDLMVLVFDGHPDLRRILTDYGFIGHPLRKDFPVTGHIEMIYDEAQKRVIYQPITIEPRENTPRVIRETGYAGR